MLYVNAIHIHSIKCLDEILSVYLLIYFHFVSIFCMAFGALLVIWASHRPERLQQHLTLVQSEQPKLKRVLAVPSAIGLNCLEIKLGIYFTISRN